MHPTLKREQWARMDGIVGEGARHTLDRMIQSHRRTGKLISRMTVAGGESEDGGVAGGGES